MASPDLRYSSKVLVLGSANVGKAELIKALKLGNGIIGRVKSGIPKSVSIDYLYDEFTLPLVDKGNVVTSDVHYEVYISANRVNHTLNLKLAYKTAEFIFFVFDITNK